MSRTCWGNGQVSCGTCQECPHLILSLTGTPASTSTLRVKQEGESTEEECPPSPPTDSLPSVGPGEWQETLVAVAEPHSSSEGHL